jgi:hypothetical protein
LIGRTACTQPLVLAHGLERDQLAELILAETRLNAA